MIRLKVFTMSKAESIAFWCFVGAAFIAMIYYIDYTHGRIDQVKEERRVNKNSSKGLS